jgi:hypothetical protein
MSLARTLGEVSTKLITGHVPEAYIETVSKVTFNAPLYALNSPRRLLTSLFPSIAHLAGPSRPECFSATSLILLRTRLQFEMIVKICAVRELGIEELFAVSVSSLSHSRICRSVDSSWPTPKRSLRASRHVLTKSAIVIDVLPTVDKSDRIPVVIDRGSAISITPTQYRGGACAGGTSCRRV